MSNPSPSRLVPFPAATPEARLLVAACRVDALRDPHVEEIVESAPLMNWTRVLELAVDHRVGPQLHAGLEHSPAAIARMPAPLWRALCEHVAHIGRYNVVLTQELLGLMSALEESGVSSIPYKGPCWSELLYGGVTHRQFGDLDLLVAPEQARAAVNCLLERGYRVSPARPAKWHLDDCLAADCELGFERALPPRMRVELHWQLFDSANQNGLAAGDVWRRAQRRRFAGRDVVSFSRADLLLYLCVHGGDKHEWSRLKWLVDLARYCAVFPRADLAADLQAARASGRDLAIRQGLFLAQHVLGAPPQLGEVDAATGSLLRALAALALGRMFRGDHSFPGFREWHHYWRELPAAAASLRGGDSADAQWCERCRLWWWYLSALCEPGWADRRAAGRASGRRREKIARTLSLVRRYKSGLLARLR